jgi:hypothetical protein
MPPLQVDDIQGILLYGYGRLRHACFLLVSVAEPADARTWLGTLDVRNAVFDPDKVDRVPSDTGITGRPAHQLR